MVSSVNATSQGVRLIPSLNTDRVRFTWGLSSVLGGGLAVRAAPEQLEPVVVDRVARPLLDVADDGSPACVIDVPAGAAIRADDMVVVHGLAGDVGVFTRRQVEALYRPQVGQDVKRAEDRGAADPKAPLAGIRDEVGRGEVPVASRDQVGDRTASLGQPVSGVIEGVLDGDGLGHEAR
jgi:hypothetical protein